LVPLFLAAPDDGNTIDNKGIHHASSFSPARAGRAVSSGAFSVWAADTPVKGGTLIYLEQQPHTNLYPPAGGFYPNGGILNQITDKLTWQNPKTLEIEPWIAESWTSNADKTEYTFHLRKGVTFSDGTPLDAAAVAKNFDTYGLGDKAHRLPVSEVINNYQRSEVIDPLTVKFYFNKPSPGFLQGTATIGSGLVSSAPCSAILKSWAMPGILSAPALCGAG
jgi:peptide/nickel transport system substrate-binding protein